MRKTLIFAACATLLSTAAFASNETADEEATEAAMAKCMADTTALGAENAAEGCTCFVDAISEDDAAAYAQISDWESEATDPMKEAGAACFPALQ